MDISTWKLSLSINPLFMACFLQVPAVIRKLLEEDTDGVRMPNIFGKTCLHLAAQYGLIDTAKTLLEYSRASDINKYGSDGWTALHHAAAGGHEEIARLLVRHDAVIDAWTQEDELFAGQRNGLFLNEPCAKLLSSSIAHADGGLVRSPIPPRIAQIAQLCGIADNIDAGIGLNGSRTALHLASAAGHGEVVCCLLNGGADLKARTKVQLPQRSGMTALELAYERGHEAIVRILLNHDGSRDLPQNELESALCAATKGGQVSTLKDLWKQVNAGANDGVLAAVLAESNLHCHISVTRFLLEQGVGVGDFTDPMGMRLSHHAAAGDFREVLELLSSHGQEFESRDNFGMTPLHHAAANGSADVVKLLLEKGTDP